MGKVKEVSYVDAHNRAVKLYQKTALFLMWGGILALFAAIIGVVQNVSGAANEISTTALWPSSGFALGYGLEIYLAFIFLTSLDSVLAGFLIILVAFTLGALFALAGLFASRGYLWVLLLGLGVYALDFVGTFFVYHASPLNAFYSWTNYAFTLVTHVIILSAGIVAIIEYYRVLDIEKRFKKENTSFEKEEETEIIASGK